ncbi:MAG TPA: Asp-tRNA(Asn)/Glu-tRNA(Gln) amidotransferase subunit GatB [Candidatus Paceibacterota bacterium]|nr:Asp-tRNA(Asn)/Glu-tRNA(Gln) amidotransferase subunit GatB [Candidatus Paceibacterota bacterium]
MADDIYSKYETVVGLEIHAELITKQKMFCSCPNNPEGVEPNTYICPVCTGQPGAMPTINLEAVKQVVKVGLALHSQIAEYSKFDRKNYFYPDLPKSYQISQYDMPLCLGGYLDIYLSNDLQPKRVTITRVHLEEDVAKLAHAQKDTLVDFNRAGVPLMELVTEPEIRSGMEARLFCEGLQILYKTLGVSEANMERGQMRCEANISVRLKGEEKLGTKVEVKNLNSFRVLEKAIDYETRRQIDLIEKGEQIIQETRGWLENDNATISQRIKENTNDYRYFYEPDLPRMHVWSKENQNVLFDLDTVKKELPKLPWDKKTYFQEVYKLNSQEANVLIRDTNVAKYYEELTQQFRELNAEPLMLEKLNKLAYNYLASDLVGLASIQGAEVDEKFISLNDYKNLIIALAEDKINSASAKKILTIITDSNNQDWKKEGLESLLKEYTQNNDEEALTQVVAEVLTKNAKAVAEYKGGKTTVIQFLLGQTMAATRGKASPETLKRLLEQEMGK